MIRNLRKRRGFGFGGGGGGICAGPVVVAEGPDGGAVGRVVSAPPRLGGDGGIDVGGAVWTFPPGGGGGVRGTFSGGIIVLELGVDGEGNEGETDATPPGAIGIGCSAVFVWDPGRTIGLGSCMLAFVFGSGFLVSANVCVASQVAVRTTPLWSR